MIRPPPRSTRTTHSFPTRRSSDLFAAAKRRFRMRALLTAMVIALLFSAMTLIMWDAVHDVASGQLTGGSLAAFVFTAGIVAGAFQALTEVYGELLRASGAAGRLSELLAESPEIRSEEHTYELPSPARGALAFEDRKS